MFLSIAFSLRPSLGLDQEQAGSPRSRETVRAPAGRSAASIDQDTNQLFSAFARMPDADNDNLLQLGFHPIPDKISTCPKPDDELT